MYTWGYLKENILSKLNMDEEQANQLGFLSRFPFYANEAMTQICSAIKPHEVYNEYVIDDTNVNTPITMPNDFISFSTDVVLYKADRDNMSRAVWELLGCPPTKEFVEVGDDFVEYDGYNQFICKVKGTYRIPYNARWFFFTKDLENEVELPIPADICDAIPSYVVGQCYKIDDEQKAAIYRNEYETFLARIDDTTFKSQRTLHIGGGW